MNVSRLCRSLGRLPDMRVTLCAQQLGRGSFIESMVDDMPVQWLHAGSWVALKLGMPTLSKLRSIRPQDSPDVMHVHGLWLPSNHWACLAARRLGAKLALHPRGLLQPWALQHKATRKRIAMRLFQERDLQGVDVFFAASHSEYEGIRRIGCKQPVAIIPNGVEIPNGVSHSLKGGGGLGRNRTLLFLSRLHPSKGLDQLLRAWAGLDTSGWTLRVVGEGEKSYEAALRANVRELGIEARVEFVGAKYGPDRDLEYQRADLFVLPTLSENFGVVVLEALAHGIPVVVTQASPWQVVEEHDCGWWVAEGAASLAGSLATALRVSDQRRHEMGENGRLLAGRYQWAEVARRTAAVYRWMIGRQDCPTDLVFA